MCQRTKGILSEYKKTTKCTLVSVSDPIVHYESTLDDLKIGVF